MEKATIVSIMPTDLDEMKHGIYPGIFKIKKSVGRIPSCLVVGRSIYYTYVGPGRGDSGTPQDRDYIKREIDADKIAMSVVNDYLDGQVLRIANEREPAIFWVPGEVSYKDLLDGYENEIAKSLENQNKWYIALITEADDIWEKSRQHKLISDTHRLAARQLNLTKPWLITLSPGQTLTTIRCAVCRSEIMYDAIVCPNCKAILKPEEIGKYKFATAGV